MSTIVEKILSEKCGRTVTPGEIVEASVDLVMFHDLTGFHVLEVMEKIGKVQVFNPDRIVVVFDHFVPPPDTRSANIQKKLRDFVKSMNIKNFHDVCEGICHVILIERGYIRPGMFVVGADSHTTTGGAVGAFSTGMGASDVAAATLTGKIWTIVPETIKVVIEGELQKGVMAKDIVLKIIGEHGSDAANFKVVEYHGSTLKKLNIDERMTLSNMSVEMGAECGIVVPDEITINYFYELGIRDIKPVLPDPNAEYCDEWHVDVSKLEPQVAVPHNIDNVKPISEVEGIEVDEVFIGSCTNGRLTDLEIAAKIMKGRKIKVSRCVVIAASRKIFLEALKRGIIQTLVEAGCVVTYGTCGPCLGGHFGLIGDGEVAVSTGSRNFKGRMGSPNGYVYVASPAVAAATAVEGKLADPRKYL